TATAELEQSEIEIGRIEAEDKRLKNDLGECETEKENILELLKEKQQQANALTILEQSWKHASEEYEIRLEFDTCKHDSLLAALALEQGKKKFEEIDRDVKQGKIELELLENQRQQGQAAILASRLQEGEACPVCGSLTHPRPAVSDVRLPSEKAVAEKKQIVLDREQTRQRLYEELNEKERFCNELQTKQDMFVKQLKDAATLDRDILNESLSRKRKALEQSKRASGEIEKIEQDLLTIRDREKNIKNLLEKNGEDIKKAAQKKGSAETRAGDLKTSIPEELQSEAALSSSLHALVEEKKYLETTIIKAKKAGDEASRKVARYNGELLQVEEALESARQSAQASAEQFAKLLEHSGFLSPEQYREASDLENEIDNLDAQVRDYHERKKAAKDRYNRVRKLIKDEVLPDMENLAAISEKATRILEDKIREEQDLGNELKRISKLTIEIRKIEKELKELDSRFRVLGYISDLANGKNRKGMTFQRFVQAALLDDVLIAASHRLSIMSKGRFLLRRVMEREDKRTSGGLNLEIDDAYTGKSRSVATLSGGESFLAALSLALGLADVVQSYAGGIRLDTLFIDEGFGSLDSESLDYALRALIDLRKDGRLVAVISHVTELRERIDTRLEIIPGKTGSTTRFITV
ncbi:MAG: hypothetical protein JXJ04_15345, partial [Spirochaetales bacterium]|nr:hypothetical protein [Spirochaetales bacterium]